MRKRNNKLNIYLNDNELKLLKERSSNLGLNHSDYIRNIVSQNFDYNTKVNNYNNDIIISELIDNINSINLVENQMKLMGYPVLENKL